MSPVEGWLARLIDAVSINETVPVNLDGRQGFQKRRRAGRGVLIAAGNVFLKWSRSRIVMFPRCADWQAWEIDSYRLLHGSTRLSQPPDARSIVIEALPGISLDALRREDRLTPEIMRAAALEFRRAHNLHSALLDAPWSHGDPHLKNVLYAETTGQAHLIDFETRHETGLAAVERHADDLLVFLLDLCSGDTANWLELSRVLLETYARPDVNAALFERLHVPTGWERVLWSTRTQHLALRQLKSRLDALRDLIAKRS